ncbi:MAG: SH3 domain-containing protein [Burkholderiaceae bacterium]|jgi:uncharacterized protein YraI
MNRTVLLFWLGLLSTAPAWGAPAYTLKSVNVRAGPARDYPLVAQLPPGATLEVGGCLNGYSWCDVYAGPLRGWVYAGNLGYPYQGQEVPILGYGPTLALPIVTFSLGAYWDQYYRGRPWYGRRSQFLHRPPPRPGIRPSPPRPAPRPPGPPPRPIPHPGAGPGPRPPGRPPAGPRPPAPRPSRPDGRPDSRP